MGGARRSGSTVSRPGGPWTPTVQRLLHHLHAHGVTWVPEPRGIDASGRDLTTFLPGDVPRYPMPEWVWDVSVLEEAARLLRHTHDASASFDRRGSTWRMAGREPSEVICHNDLGPHNMVFIDGRAAGIIDWDLAAPGPRVWDLAHLAYRLVPLTAEDNPDVPVTDLRWRAARLRLLCERYGTGAHPGAVLQAAAERVAELARFTEEAARAVAPDLAAHPAIYRADLDWLRRTSAALLAEAERP